jgi:hypothetical protein
MTALSFMWWMLGVTLILFLLGGASAFVNGEMLIVDGGVYTQ